jgi:hypothetical protein
VPDLFVVEELTIDKPYGWVFFYDSRRAVESDYQEFAIAGNAPFLVNRNGDIHTFGTALPVETYIAEYERQHSPKRRTE